MSLRSLSLHLNAEADEWLCFEMGCCLPGFKYFSRSPVKALAKLHRFLAVRVPWRTSFRKSFLWIAQDHKTRSFRGFAIALAVTGELRGSVGSELVGGPVRWPKLFCMLGLERWFVCHVPFDKPSKKGINILQKDRDVCLTWSFQRPKQIR